MQTYPYFTLVRIDAGQMVKLFVNRKYNSYIDAVIAISKYAENHSEVWKTNQYAILKYENLYQSRIQTIFTNDICTNISYE